MTPGSTDLEAKALLTALKQLLRERRIGYQSIADAMEVSLPTVKRMLNKPGLPLDRLFAVCRIAKIDAVDVFSIAAKQHPQHTTFTAEQDDLFFQRPDFLTYFIKLTEEQLSPDEIAKAEGLTQHSTQKYLTGLAKVSLIERDTGNKIRILIDPPFGFGPDSKVLRSQHAEFLKNTIAQVLSPDRPEGVFAIMKPLNLQRELYSEMLKELRATIDKYAYHSEHPSHHKLPDRKLWNLTIAAGPSEPLETTPLT